MSSDIQLDSKYKNVCLWMTLGWLILFNIICWLGIFETPNSLNEVGDFFAGLFSPIAFLWLIYGYFQNSQTIQLQIQEMKEGVQEQKKLVEVYKNEEKARHYSVQPFLNFISKGVKIEEIVIDEYYDAKGRLHEHNRSIAKVEIVIENQGELAKQLVILDPSFHDLQLFSIIELAKKESTIFISTLDPDQFDELQESYEMDFQYELFYKDIYGLEYQQTLSIHLIKDFFSSNHYSASVRVTKFREVKR